MSEIVYGLIDYAETLAFVHRDVLEEWRHLIATVEGCSTYGELRQAVKSLPLVHASLPIDLEDYDVEDWPDEMPFDARETGACCDGDWPRAAQLLTWEALPAEVAEKYAGSVMTVFSGEFAEIDPADEAAIVADLAALGFTCVRDDDAIEIFGS